MAPVRASKASRQSVKAGSHPTGALIAQKWWAVAARGVLGILLGVIALLPGATLLSLVYVFAVYAVLDGAFAVVSAFRAARHHRHWGLLVLEGAAGILTGALVWAWPGISVTAFVLLVGVWALVSGFLMFRGAFALHIDHGRWWLVLGGVASMVFGGILTVSALKGAVVLPWWVGVYALIFGAALLVLAVILRARTTDQPNLA
jgi:uncharacterized membrane protein HdeD (DUF308 family)